VLGHLKIKTACGGDRDWVRQVVRLGGFVGTTGDFKQHAAVMNGASDLAVECSVTRGVTLEPRSGPQPSQWELPLRSRERFWIA